jgi:hypothetical protein
MAAPYNSMAALVSTLRFLKTTSLGNEVGFGPVIKVTTFNGDALK